MHLVSKFAKHSHSNYLPKGSRSIVLSAREGFRGPSVGFHLHPSPTEVEESTIGRSKIKVITFNTPSPTTTLSVYVKAGSKYENIHTEGSTHFLKHLAFKTNYSKSGLRFVRDLEQIGASFHTEISRETIAYHFEGLRIPVQEDPIPFSVLAESCRSVLSPLLYEYDVREAAKSVEREAAEAESDAYTSIMERVHLEAYGESGLGRPLFIPSYAVHHVTNQTIYDHYTSTFFGQGNVYIVGTGIDHRSLVYGIDGLFENLSPIITQELYGSSQETHQYTGKNEYIGGATIRLPGPAHTSLALVFRGVGTAHHDAAAYGILRHILGGGSRNNTTPGDSRLTSRLYRNVIDPNNFVEEVKAFHTTYADTGLFGVYATAAPGNAGQLFNAIGQQINSLKSIGDEELAHAKVNLKGEYFRYLQEDVFNLVNNISASELAGRPFSSDRVLQGIDAVSVNDVQKVVSEMLQSAPILVAAGDVRGLPKL